MAYLPLKHPVIDGPRGFLSRPWTLWAALVQRLINDIQIRPVSGTSQTVDWANGHVYALTLTANCVLTFLNPIAGHWYTLVVTQDAIGGWTIIWPPPVGWPMGTPPTMTAMAGASQVFEFLYVPDRYLGTFSLEYGP